MKKQNFSFTSVKIANVEARSLSAAFKAAQTAILTATAIPAAEKKAAKKVQFETIKQLYTWQPSKKGNYYSVWRVLLCIRKACNNMQ